MFCRKCGAEIRLNAKFCAKCGTPAAKASETRREEARTAIHVAPSELTKAAAVGMPKARDIRPEEPAKLIINMPETKQKSSNGQFNEWFTEADDL